MRVPGLIVCGGRAVRRPRSCPGVHTAGLVAHRPRWAGGTGQMISPMDLPDFARDVITSDVNLHQSVDQIEANGSALRAR
jgi:hypothetical protein